MPHKDPAERRAYNARYYAEHREEAREYNARYRASEMGHATKARYRASEMGRAAQARYNASEKGRASDARYRASEKGRAAHDRAHTKDVVSGTGAKRKAARYGTLQEMTTTALRAERNALQRLEMWDA